MSYVDPTKYRLSDSFLLSDFMGCDSVYRRGYANKIEHDDELQMRKGRFLAETLEGLQGNLGPCRVIYGYISPDLSRKLVKYQDPDKPSHHRWDLGAAADITFPDYFAGKGEFRASPIELARDIHEYTLFSRLITYSESDYLCFAVNDEETEPRAAFYENRYVSGQRKPEFIRFSPDPAKRKQQMAESIEFVRKRGWKGQGWPSYHGGGHLQYEHEKIGTHRAVIDFLYNKYHVLKGKHNRPPANNGTNKYDLWLEQAARAGEVVTSTEKQVGTRVSIVSAYDRWSKTHNWEKAFTLEMVLPLSQQHRSAEIAEMIESMSVVKWTKVVESWGEKRIRVQGAT